MFDPITSHVIALAFGVPLVLCVLLSRVERT